MPVLETRLSARAADFLANAAAMRSLVDDLRAKFDQVAQGGGETARARHSARGKLLPRDRVEMLLDPGTPFWSCRHWRRWACTRTATAATARPAPV